MNVLDLFSGIGGFTLGLEAAGMSTTAFCECEEHAIKVLNKNFKNVPVHTDVKTITKEWINRNEKQIDLICGGFPCQDVSIAGKRKGIEQGEKSGLWREFKRLIEELKPRYALIENVAGLLSGGIEIVLSDLSKIGYDATWTTLDSQYFGVPQRRRRVYILAVRDGIPADSDIFRFNERNSAELRKEMEAVSKSRTWDFKERKGIKYPFAYYTRQRSDQFNCLGVASTLAKRDYKSFTDLVVDSEGVRRVTPQERLLLQGFPQDFFDGCDISVKDQFTLNGMSVPVVKWIGERVIEFDKGLKNNEH